MRDARTCGRAHLSVAAGRLGRLDMLTARVGYWHRGEGLMPQRTGYRYASLEDAFWLNWAGVPVEGVRMKKDYARVGGQCAQTIALPRRRMR